MTNDPSDDLNATEQAINSLAERADVHTQRDYPRHEDAYTPPVLYAQYGDGKFLVGSEENAHEYVEVDVEESGVGALMEVRE